MMQGRDGNVILEVKNFNIDYIKKGKPPAHAVGNVSFKLHEGELLGVVGESGCGKTTLMLGITRLLPPAGRITHGKVLFKNTDWMKLSEPQMREVRWRDISFIFQGAMNALNPVKTVGDQIIEAMLLHLPISKVAAQERLIELLDMVGIGSNRKDNYPHQFSGGMRQRAMIAMALACMPSIVIADEPTTALDVMIQAQIIELLMQLRDKLQTAVMLVTHDLGVVAEMCDSVVVMYSGVVAEYANVDTIFNTPLHPYTQELLKAIPDLNRPNEKLRSIPGYPPQLDNLPKGCRFSPRCPKAIERCFLEQPETLEITPGHFTSCHLVEPK
ncbi:MAG: ABC transporter ATP-binding protein [Chloroflexi bacterium]|nr:ABC transporter ATP-binding protein [Chloroflexota bacterium]